MSVGALWQRAPRPPVADDLERDGIAATLAELLARRGVTSAEAAQRFLHPDLDQLHDPFLLFNMEGAVERLLAAREKNQRLAIVGDYDVDGVSATALLCAAFRACALEVETIIPHRMEEGYGFQPLHVERAQEMGCEVIVTADCGTTSHAAVEAAQAAGIDVIVTDHHIPDAPLPGSALQINPKLSECSYPFDQLCGAGLAFKLAMAFGQRCGREFDARQFLRIACLGTIADLVPLVDENRAIAALGLEAIGPSRSAGLRALIHQAGVQPPVTATDVGFRLGPRINAAGRLGSAQEALDLLLCRDPREASALARRLDDWNRQRQKEEVQVVDEARSVFRGWPELPPILVAWSERWHRGVVGIAAGRLARELRRPTILLSVDGEAATGSGRSISAVDLHQFLIPWREDLERFGGHAQAVGLTASTDRLEALRSAWQEAGRRWPEEYFQQRYEYELELSPREVTIGTLEELEALEPHGEANRQPLIRVGPLRLRKPPRRFGKGHISAQAEGEGGAPVALLGWRWAERSQDLRGDFEVLAYLERDHYRGGPTLRLLDCRAVS